MTYKAVKRNSRWVVLQNGSLVVSVSSKALALNAIEFFTSITPGAEYAKKIHPQGQVIWSGARGKFQGEQRGLAAKNGDKLDM